MASHLIASLAVALLATLPALLGGCEDRRRINPFDPSNPETRGEPGLMRAVAGNAEVRLAWDLGSVRGLSGVRLLRREHGAESEVAVFEESGGDTRHSGEFIDQGVTNNATYAYRLEVRPARGQPLYTAVDLATPGASEPWVGDAFGGGLVRLTPDGRRALFRIGTWRSILDMKFENDGGFWSADFGNGTILSYDDSGQLRTSWELYGASSVAVDRATGRIWAGSFYRQLVTLRERDGTEVWTDPGAGLVEAVAAIPGGGAWVAGRRGGVRRIEADRVVFIVEEFVWPSTLSVEADGSVWVVDRRRGVFKIDPYGLEVRQSPVTFVDPMGGDIGEEGEYWTADRGRGGLSLLDSGLEEVAFFPVGPVENVTWDPAGSRLWLCYGGHGDIEVHAVTRVPSGPPTLERTALLHLGGHPVRVAGIWR